MNSNGLSLMVCSPPAQIKRLRWLDGARHGSPGPVNRVRPAAVKLSGNQRDLLPSSRCIKEAPGVAILRARVVARINRHSISRRVTTSRKPMAPVHGGEKQHHSTALRSEERRVGKE